MTDLLAQQCSRRSRPVASQHPGLEITPEFTEKARSVFKDS